MASQPLLLDVPVVAPCGCGKGNDNDHVMPCVYIPFVMRFQIVGLVFEWPPVVIFPFLNTVMIVAVLLFYVLTLSSFFKPLL